MLLSTPPAPTAAPARGAACGRGRGGAGGAGIAAATLGAGAGAAAGGSALDCAAPSCGGGNGLADGFGALLLGEGVVRARNLPTDFMLYLSAGRQREARCRAVGWRKCSQGRLEHRVGGQFSPQPLDPSHWIFGRSRNHERATMYKALSRLEAGWSRRSGRSLRDGPRMVPGAPRARLDLLGRVKPSVYVGVYN